jgi:predicted Zn-dependent protease with MMP-like domain
MTVKDVATRFLARLPEELREELEGVRVMVLAAPTAELLEAGVSETTPAAYLEDEEAPFFDGDDDQARAIYLFTDNIKPLSQKTVENLVLHEVGHALGLEEDEVRAALEDGEEEATS